MSTSAVSAATTSSNTYSSTTSTSSMDQEDFLTLLVSQLQNQNPLEPTSADKILDQMLSYAGYEQQSDMNETLSSISSTLESIASALDITV